MKIHQITIGELLTHNSPDVRRHATGALKALERHEKKITLAQDHRMANGCIINHDHFAHPLDCIIHD